MYGGSPYDKQTSQLAPARRHRRRHAGPAQDLIDKGYCRIDDVELTVLDEADHLCDLGFYPAVDELLEADAASGPADAAQRHARR